MTQRSTPDTIEWLRTHETTTELGYNPNGRCLQITREARDIDAYYPSAFAAMLATPEEFRVYSIKKITKGMVGYFDEANDSNPYGHVVTWLGWEKDSPRESLHDLFCKTNSVVSGRTVVVRGDYFFPHWGDSFKFAATWLNGVELDLPERKPKAKPIQKFGKKKLEAIVNDLDRLIEIQKKKGNPRAVKALRRDKQEIIKTLENFS